VFPSVNAVIFSLKRLTTGTRGNNLIIFPGGLKICLG
jgi:hypothetical protein